jgi:hypothetical protein
MRKQANKHVPQITFEGNSETAVDFEVMGDDGEIHTCSLDFVEHFDIIKPLLDELIVENEKVLGKRKFVA